MILQYGILFLILLVAAISTTVFSFMSKSKAYVRNISFYSLLYYFVLSLLKWYLGNSDISLISSFWEVQPATYVHYGVPLVALAIVFPVFFQLILKNKSITFIEWSTSLCIISFPVIAVSKGGISNSCYVIVYIGISLVVLFFSVVSKNKLIFINKSELISSIKKNCVIAFLPTFLVMFYYPNELYFTNISEFYNPYWSFALILGICMVLFALCILFCLCLLPVSWGDYCRCFIFGLSICGYLQAMFFNRSLVEMLGTKREWSIGTLVINAALWVIILAVIMFFSIKHEQVRRWINWISIFVISMLTITLLTLVLQNVSNFNNRYGELTHEGDLVLAPSNNVLVFILDMYDIRFFEDALASNPDFEDELKDFVLYDDAIARHPYTNYSIPYLLTGSQWGEDNGPIFPTYAYDDNSMFNILYSNGVDMGIYTSKVYLDESQYYKASNYKDEVVRESDVYYTVLMMTRASLYKISPYILKNKYIYDTSDISWMVKYGDVWSDYNDIPFYERITSGGLTINDSLESAFRFYHMRGTHYPYYLSEDMHFDRTRSKATRYSQAKASMSIVFLYLEKLRELGLYDDTTIIISADHGEIIGYDSETKSLSDVSRPILLVKKAGEKGDELRYNHAQVSHQELIPTILDAYGLDYSLFGRRLEDIDENEQRERYFGYYSNREGVVTGKVVGNGAELKNWIVD